MIGLNLSLSESQADLEQNKSDHIEAVQNLTAQFEGTLKGYKILLGIAGAVIVGEGIYILIDVFAEANQ